MAKQVVDLREILKQYRFEENLLQKIDCSKEENNEFKKLLKSNNDLPDGVYEHKSELNEGLGDFYRVYETDLSKDEVEELLQLKSLQHLKTIKYGIIFFVVLTVISLICSIILITNLS